MPETTETRASRRIKPRRLQKNTRSAPLPLDISGRICPSAGLPYPSYLHFRMADGTEIVHSNDAIARAGRCPHCFMDFLNDAGLFHCYRDELHLCDFDLDGPRDDVRRNGKDLIAVLWSLGIPRIDPVHLFNHGGRA